MTNEDRDPRLAEFSDGDLRREIGLREQEGIRQQLVALGPCPECGAAIRSLDSNVIETFRSAPKWNGWPAPPPPHLEQIDGQRWEVKLVCENGHETVRDEIRMRDTAKP